ncbi:UDP-N-acetylmuramoyl-L-alanyl-D-glutamate--2,6-diaminopimelate ligase [Candidatus Thioglobus sp.]|jgi:UDP-N-acetylmuramoylalanyl-D-glutamate--2,6-diaminopimelate ligase (EC 6.3.2.13)|uniref:UDP-N-acetylmuramoyl-L-alanyl-D-glutamate--2, 6-diaminopimelate ligase n=1 Tax=Candidatus Thioglobus sp. TaxID=2026721 RepID=UPI001763660C|nr:UDP-N-acetylmuramoyl-L-alanyl-D-glutamate--2,6-diaminopimelate ligase [Candidatus Thioglobus sp.]
MNINQLLADITPTLIDVEIQGLCLNAANVQTGDLFIALQGETTHGINHIERAIEKGCVAVLVDSQDLECAIPTIRIENLKQYLPALASAYYSQATKVEVIGVTGTNGKTSVAYFISQLLDQLGIKNGLIGTLGITHSKQKSRNTTPDILTLYRVLDDYHNKQINTAVLEVSSHALSQNRIQGLNITQAVFTNFSQDHLDYHHTLNAYRDEKLKLFELDSLNNAIINKDDESHSYFLNAAKNKNHWLYSINDFDDIKTTEQGFLVQLNGYVFEIPLLGEFNLLNIMAAYNSIKALGFDDEKVIPLLHKLFPPPGRMQKINNRLAWVDYAHTPDALEKAIITLKMHYSNHKIRVVFGCGGNRDQGKRAKMGKIASKLADTVILTNDNPRDEDPQAIINDILNGIDDSFELDITLDRQLAIETAMTTLNENECLLIAGKGHESTQEFKDKTLILSDIEIAQNATN